ncbi:hypothetical protein FH972_008983 [Carpinus fangiana]|uniref:TATA box-binding protein-associated factor RNA polymerase I subunit B n=1 Tax=Carpinus fangiana TaxID=176857 RepID=A0A5N6R0E3_9ROSI|nr:hypothetical protein FH972_008983 [Carpinus fangiana]
MSDPENWTCNICCNVGLEDVNDGFYYCVRCGARVDDLFVTGVAEEDFKAGGLYLACHRRRRNTSTVKAEQLSQPFSDSPNPSSFWNTLTLDAEATPKPQRPIKTEEYFDDGVGASGPEDFGGSNHPFVSMKVTETTRKRPNKIRKHK